MQPRNRQQILSENGLHGAPPALQEAFWRRYNLPRRREVAGLGELAADWLAEHRAGSQQQEALLAAWRDVVPADLLRHSRVEGLSRGRLRVWVDSAATRYTLTRRLGQTLIEALNAKLGKPLVRRIEYRLMTHLNDKDRD